MPFVEELPEEQPEAPTPPLCSTPPLRSTAAAAGTGAAGVLGESERSTAQAREARAKRLVAQAAGLIEAADWEEAAAVLATAVELVAPAPPAWHVNLANCLCELSGREAEAEAHYQTAMLSKQPPSFEVLANYGLYLSERGDEREQDALRTLRAAVELNPAWAQGQYNLGNLLTSLGAEHEAEALACYRAAVKHGPREADFHNNYALCLSNAGDLRSALQHAQHAISLSPQRVDLGLNFAELLFASGETRMAVQAAAKAVQNSKGQPVAEAGAYALLGSLLQAAGDSTRATSALAQAWQRVYEQAVSDDGGRPATPLSLPVLEQRYRHGLKYASRLTAMGQHVAAAAVYRQLAELSAAQSAAVRAQGSKDTDSGLALSASLRDEALFHALLGDRTTAAGLHRTSEEVLTRLAQVSTTSAVVPTISAGCLGAISGLQLSSTVGLCNKAALARNLEAAGLASCAPATTVVTSYEEVARLVIASSSSSGGSSGSGMTKQLWYLKDPHVQRGQGVYIFDQLVQIKHLFPDREQSPQPKQWVLQKAVHPLTLLDGRKFGLRVHVFVVVWPPAAGDKRSSEPEPQREPHAGASKSCTTASTEALMSVYMFSDAILTKCGTTFDPSDTSKLAQITCTSVQRSLPGYSKDEVKGTASSLWGLAKWRAIYPKLRRSVLESVRAASTQMHSVSLQPNPSNSSAGAGDGAMIAATHFGYDYLVKEDNGGDPNDAGTLTQSPVLIEVNQAPQVGDPQSMPSLRNCLGVPMINGIVEIVSEAVALWRLRRRAAMPDLVQLHVLACCTWLQVRLGSPLI